MVTPFIPPLAHTLFHMIRMTILENLNLTQSLSGKLMELLIMKMKMMNPPLLSRDRDFNSHTMHMPIDMMALPALRNFLPAF
jgi:hypothetical protein